MNGDFNTKQNFQTPKEVDFMWQYNNELYHWGIPGMKWGVRRYQNRDGSLTNAGKKRYSEVEQPKPRVSEDAYKAYANRRRDIGELSNQELRQLNERMQLEQQYRQLTSNAQQKGKGQKFAEEVAWSVGKTLVTKALTSQGEKYMASKGWISLGGDKKDKG